MQCYPICKTIFESMSADGKASRVEIASGELWWVLGGKLIDAWLHLTRWTRRRVFYQHDRWLFEHGIIHLAAQRLCGAETYEVRYILCRGMTVISTLGRIRPGIFGDIGAKRRNWLLWRHSWVRRSGRKG